jgi:hypothetical protein
MSGDGKEVYWELPKQKICFMVFDKDMNFEIKLQEELRQQADEPVVIQ